MHSGMDVLCVDDDPDVRDLTATFLERTADAIEVTTAPSGRDGIERIDQQPIDCVVSDYDMPGLSGLEFLEVVRERDPELPFILFTGKGSEEIASEAISAGVTDYVRKEPSTDQYAVLANRIENAIAKRRADQARRRSERELEQYRTLVETAVDPMYVLDDSGVCLVVNEALADFVGCDRERMIGNRLEQFVDSDAYERGAKSLERLVGTGHKRDRLEVTITQDNGERRVGEVHLTALTDDGAFDGSVGVVRDISDRKERERELQTYERIVELAPIALFTLDETGTISWLNDEFAVPFEESPAELRGTTFRTLIDRGYYDERVARKYEEKVRQMLSSRHDSQRAMYSVRFRSADGDVEIHDVHTKLLPLEDGEFAGTIHAVRDMTQRRRHQRELERQNDRLEQFASLVSHDLRNPLNVAQGSLESHASACHRTDDHIENVRDSLGRMNELIDHLLSLAHHGRTVGEPTAVPLSQLARDAWDSVDTGGATLELDGKATILVDTGRAQELLENLFRNCVEHGDGDPTITVGTLTDDDAMETAVYVADDGPGLPPGEPTETLFEFGYTTSESGTGLGLAIVREIAEAHDWTITATDSADGGARFEFRDITIGADQVGAHDPGTVSEN
ncbi:PAS domain S-box protein [Salinadaptatus halalkaliphilus]|uniref:histidine kinase n=1 Tax=Salinadaptatus halalkaliphilus TaxID=2419781 RepID=A0A4S3TMF8_9EURY|nr:PAS domain S-box protein [Salinadaptatus halalkaliphilus]THE65419.1 PAS domain S-box protein [Salinadaptatus halalkaliphilus]